MILPQSERGLQITEEVLLRRDKIEVKNWKRGYQELKDILERGYDFDRIEEVKFRHHLERGMVKSVIKCYKEKDRYSHILIILRPIINVVDEEKGIAEVNLRTKGVVVTIYPEKTAWQDSILYYTLRSIWDKFVYGWAREKWKDEAEEMVVDIQVRIRQFLRSLGD